MRPKIYDDPAPAGSRVRLRRVGGGEPAESGFEDDEPGEESGWVPPQRSLLGQRLTRSGPWGELAERWVPEPLRGARVDPSRRGAIAVAVVALSAAVVAAVAVWWMRPAPEPLAPAELVPVESTELAEAGPAEVDEGVGSSAEQPVDLPTGPILISVTGEVARPGLVTVPADARVADAIVAAGGALEISDLTGLNLAARLADGDSIVVAGPSGSVLNSDGTSPGTAASGGSVDASLVDINRADAAGLQQLPGVGPVTAEAIVTYRTEHGPFRSGEQLQEVSGIGPATMTRLGPLITW